MDPEEYKEAFIDGKNYALQGITLYEPIPEAGSQRYQAFQQGFNYGLYLKKEGRR